MRTMFSGVPSLTIVMYSPHLEKKFGSILQDFTKKPRMMNIRSIYSVLYLPYVFSAHTTTQETSGNSKFNLPQIRHVGNVSLSTFTEMQTRLNRISIDTNHANGPSLR